MLSSISSMVGLETTGDEKPRVSRAVRRQHELQERKIAKRADVKINNCIGMGKDMKCTADHKACQFGFNFEEEDPAYEAGCTEKTAPGGKKWGSGECKGNQGEMLVYCFCDDGDKCGGKDAMLKKAKDEYLKMNPPTTTTTTTTTTSSPSTTESGGGGFPIEWVIGGSVAIAIVVGGAIFAIFKFTNWFSFLTKKNEDSDDAEDAEEQKKKEDEEKNVSEEEINVLLARILGIVAEKDKVAQIIEESRLDAAKPDFPVASGTSSSVSMDIFTMPGVTEGFAFFKRLIEDHYERVVLIDCSDVPNLLNILPDREGPTEAITHGEASRSCLGTTVTLAESKKNKVTLKFGKELPVCGLQSIIKRKCTISISGARKKTKMEFLDCAAFRKIILNFEGCALGIKTMVYDPKKTAILIPSPGEVRGAIIKISYLMLNDVKEKRQVETKQRVAEVMKAHPDATKDFNADALRTTSAVVLCGLRQRMPRSLPPGHTEVLDGYCTRLLFSICEVPRT